MNLIQKAAQLGLVSPPDHVLNQTQYLVTMGSNAYGCALENSDYDVYGFCIPPKAVIFPHTAGEIRGFGTPLPNFEEWQHHHVFMDDKEYDFSVKNIVRYVQLLMENNPNIIDSIFVPQRCIFHCSSIAQIIRDNRTKFLNKRCYHKFRGYAYSQLHKMQEKKANMLITMEKEFGFDDSTTEETIVEKIKTETDGKKKDSLKTFLSIRKEIGNGNRLPLIRKYGYDVKFGSHVVRLMDECRQILETGTLNLEQSSEVLKSIRRGEWAFEKIVKYFEDNEKHLDNLYNNSKLPYSPDEREIKNILMNCLEQHFGSLKNVIEIPNKEKMILQKIKQMLDNNGI